MRRREFLIGAAAATGLATTSRGRVVTAAQAKLDRVAILSSNFNSILKKGVGAPVDPAQTLDIMDFPQMIADRYGVRRIELQHADFLSTEPAYLKELRDRLTKAKSQLVQINLEFGANTASTTGFSGRLQAIDLTKAWIEHAAALGCPRVMVNQGPLTEAARPTAIEALKIMGDYGRARKVTVTVENRDTGEMPPPPPPPPPAPPAGAGAPPAAGRGGGRGGAGAPPPPPATWQVVVEVIKAAGIAASPDLGNFPNDQERTAGLRALFPLSAGGSHARYNPAKFDLANTLKIAREVGYKGLFSVETGSPAGSDPHAGTKALLDQLLKLI